uniref:Uncharacterized protein n=1 Tax=Anopheles albimanus TaxID=7167 RepID=A0A8W7K7M3_ANOAL
MPLVCDDHQRGQQTDQRKRRTTGGNGYWLSITRYCTGR